MKYRIVEEPWQPFPYAIEESLDGKQWRFIANRKDFQAAEEYIQQRQAGSKIIKVYDDNNLTPET